MSTTAQVPNHHLHAMARLPFAWSLAIVQFSKLIYPAILLTLALTFTSRHYDISIPGWLVGVAAVACIIPYHVTVARLRLWRQIRKARSLGAIMPPRWEGEQLGGRDVLALLDDAYFNGYLSELLVLRPSGIRRLMS